MASESSTAGQPNVRIIPIQVEGRDYVGKHEANQSEPTLHNELPHQPEQPTQRVNSGSSMGFGAEIPRHHFQSHDRPAFGRMHFDDGFGDDDIDGFNRNSIFDRVKDFPVKDFFPTRMASPGRGQNPVFTQAGAGQSHSPPRQQQQQQPNKSQQQQSQQQPPQQNQQQQQQQHPQPPPQDQRPEERQKSPTPQPPPPTKMKEDSIEKIKKIQADVLALMDQVEHFEATGRKDKRALYLDEMLTQNLLKLDTVDTEGKDNIKLARREAIKCINHCISVLEAKVEAAEEAATNNQPSDDSASGNPAESHDTQLPADKKSASADNVLRNNAEQSADIKKSSSQK